MRPNVFFVALALALALAVAAGALRADPAGAGKPAYPPTRTGDEKDVLHGLEVPDPYRWLEPDDAPDVVAWDQAQWAFLRQRLDGCSERADLKRRVDTELDQGDLESLPVFAGERMFTTFRAPGKNHAALFVRGIDDPPPGKVVLDPDAWSQDGTEGMPSTTPSPDGRYVAYERDSKGSEMSTLYVRDVETGKDLPEHFTRTKFTSVEWRADARSFYYTRLPAPDDVPKDEAQYHYRVRMHVLGTSVLDDPLVYGQGRPMIEDKWMTHSTDRRHRFLVRGIPEETLDTFEIDETWGAPRLVPLLVGNDSRTYVDTLGDLYVLNSDFQAPRRRVCTAARDDVQDPKKWKVVVPEGQAVIQSVDVVKDRLLVNRRENLVSHLLVVSPEGQALGEVDLPSQGSVDATSVRPDDTRVWFTFEAQDVPTSEYVVDLGSAPKGSGAAARWTPRRLATLPTTIHAENLVSERFDYPSKDGTKIPMFVVHAKSTPLDGSAPTVLYAYGGFRIGQYPYFSRGAGLWADLGGVFAVASIRGGDEFGEDWHAGGCLAKKQNVFDDFIAGADWLVSTGKAKRERLAIRGGSNGGLLVAAVLDQRPDLCRAAVCEVPLTDMLRYARFQYAKDWTKEYGDPDVPAEFQWLRAYSPYHNVKPAAYPAVMVTAGLTDGRVNAFHARKIVARWQAASTSEHPILLYLDRESGHNSSSEKQAKAEALDRLCFLRMELGGK